MSDQPYVGQGDMRISMDDINDKAIEKKLAALQHPLWLPDGFKDWLGDFALRVATDFYSKQVEGLRANRFRQAENAVDLSDAVTSGVFYSPLLDGRGPFLRHLQNGLWMFIIGCDPGNNTGQHDCNTVVNNVYPDDPIQDMQSISGSSGSMMGIVVNDISPTAYRAPRELWTQAQKDSGIADSPVRPTANNDNTIELQYFVPAASSGVQRRHMTGVLIQDLAATGHGG